MAELDLVATSGPLEGTRFRLRREEPLLLGRSSRGVHLADPKVSVQHAQIEFVGKGYVLTDLGSSTGTRVGGVLIEASKPVPIDAGFSIQVGESEFRLLRVSGGRWAVNLSLGVLVLVLGGLGWVRFAAKEGGTILVWRAGIHTGPGPATQQVAVPPDFLRRHGLGPSTVTIDRIGDDDGNGIDEIWLTSASAQFVITFDENGTWMQLGELPLGCDPSKSRYDEARDVAPELPIVRCGGETWMVTGGRYELVSHDAAAVWLDPSSATPPPASPAAKGKERPKKSKDAKPASVKAPVKAPKKDTQVVRLRLVHPERISAFLVSRGINEGVHYLICEGAIEGLAAQARTTSGKLVRLSPGCLDEVLFEGEKLGDVLMVAFTAVGRRALLDDLASTWGGSPEGLWMDPAKAEQLKKLSVEPGLPRGASRLTSFRIDGELPWIMAPEVPLGERVRLIPSIQSSTPPEPPAVVRTLTEAGDQVIDPPGCPKYLLTVDAFTCRMSAGCVSSQSFLRLIEVGCGQPRTVLEVPYESGVVDLAEPTKIRARIVTRDLPDGVEIARADIGWIPTPEPN